MSAFGTRLKALQEEQERLLAEYRNLVAEYASRDLLRDNEELKTRLAESRRELDGLRAKLERLQEENVRLRTALTEQVIDEKRNLVKLSRRKLETYFTAAQAGAMNRLTSFEQQARSAIDGLANQAANELGEMQQDFTAKLEALSRELAGRIQAMHRQQAEEGGRLAGRLATGWDAMAAEGVDEAVLEKRMKQNRIEMKIGLNWVNRLGILLILLGVGAVFRYSYTAWFNDYMKGAAFLLLGLLMLAAGEWFSRRRQRVFALGLIGGGVAVLYGDIFYSTFLLKIIGQWTGLLLSVLVTAATAALALRYRSRTVCLFGLIGGYLPLYSFLYAFGLAGAAVYAAMGYLFVLNAFILLLSFRQRWPIVHFVGFFLNMFSSGVLAFLAESVPAGMVHIFVTFALYVAVVLGYPLLHRVKVGIRDLVLLGLNTMAGTAMLYALLEKADWGDYAGLASLLFGLAFLLLGRLVGATLPGERQTKVLFDATALSFAIVFIPFQFGARWLSLGWLIEGIVLLFAGVRFRFKWLERAGWALVLLCLLVFVWWDGLLAWLLYGEPSLFNLKYSFISLGMVLVALVCAQRLYAGGWPAGRPRGEAVFQRVFGHAALVNLWFYLLYEVAVGFGHWRDAGFPHPGFYRGLSSVLVTLALAYGIGRIRMLRDRFSHVFSIVLSGIGCFIGLAITLSMPVLRERMADNTAADFVALVILAGFNVLVYFVGRDLLLTLVRRQYRNLEIYPLLAGVYLIAVMTGFLIVQFRLGAANLVLSLLELLLSIAFVVYGFRRRFVYIRRLGLGLSLLATAKLFLYDLAFLAPSGKIAAYFCFGLVLLGISLLYQRLSVRMGEQAEPAEPGASPESGESPAPKASPESGSPEEGRDG